MIRRPSKCQHIQIETSRFLPPKGYYAITFFGKILIREHNAENWKRNFETKSGKIMLNHEWIHVRQAVSTHNSWICFYIRYVFYYLKNRPLRNGQRFAYYTNPFEVEAYSFEADLSYTHDKPNGANGWRTFAAMPLNERKEIMEKINVL